MRINDNIKDKISKTIIKNKIYKILDIINDVYKLKTLKVINIIHEYDSYEILIGYDTLIKYRLIIDENGYDVKFIDHDNKYIDVYEINNYGLNFKRRVYKKNNNKIIYDPRNVIKYKDYFINKIEFKNTNLDTTIEYSLPIQNKEDEIIYNILNSNLKNVYDLYQILKEFNIQELKIINHHKLYEEYIEIKNQELVGCKIKDLETNQIFDYQNNELYITKKSDPNTNDEFKKIKKKFS